MHMKIGGRGGRENYLFNMRIEKKTWPDCFEKNLSGEKNFDLRLNDFVCQTGDILVLREWDPSTKNYTGREIEKQVKYVAKIDEFKFWKPEDIEKYGFQVISF